MRRRCRWGFHRWDHAHGYYVSPFNTGAPCAFGCGAWKVKIGRRYEVQWDVRSKK